MICANEGFTLIELLVSVAIISLLSAIGLANFSEAQTRAKATRVQGDLRTLAGAIELYSLDYNQHPRMAHFKFFSDPNFDLINAKPVSGVMSKALSSPVAYISSAHLLDPFMSKMESAPVDERIYTYQDIQCYIIKIPQSKFWPMAQQYYGNWRIGSPGPDLTFDHGFKNSAQLPYDSTNGTVSLGNIWRSFNKTQETQLPPVDLLGEH